MGENKQFTYLDYSATSPLCAETVEAMRPYLVAGLADGAYLDANANALYGPGRTAFRALEEARQLIARALGARPDEIIFTSCSSEADNAALVGLAHAFVEGHHLDVRTTAPRIIISATEHDAILQPAKRLEREGFELVILPVDKLGKVQPETLQAVLTTTTVLVSIQAANGEIGSIQDVAALAKLAHQAGALFHTDATQALGKIPVDLAHWGVDAASFSAHKVGGPKGVGILYLKARTPFQPQLLGGGQESGYRSGTQNVAGAVGAAAAVEVAVSTLSAEHDRLRNLRDRLYEGLCAWPQVHPTIKVPAGSDEVLCNVVNVHVDGLEGPTLVLRFNNQGFCVSAGSACSSGSLDPSRALTALGLARDEAQGELRVSIGRYTTADDVERFLDAVPRVIGG